MSTERLARALAILMALLALALETDAQRRRGQQQQGAGRGSTRGRGNSGAGFTPPRPLPVPKGPIYLPGFEQAGKKKPAAQADRSTEQKNEPIPLDPKKAADEVTATADYLARADVARQKFLREHFVICDLDGNGWLSLREGEVTLSLDRAEFRRADSNRDGRLVQEEFNAQQGLLLARLGTEPDVPPDQPPSELPTDPHGNGDPGPSAADGAPQSPRTGGRMVELTIKPIDLMRRYDTNRDHGIDVEEVGKLFKETGLVLSPELVLAQMDPNDSGKLELRELVPIAWLVSKHLPEALRPPPAHGDTSQEDLDALAREMTRALTHFGRLDGNGDGFIDDGDLRALQNPVRLDLRLRTLISAMDQDADGRISEAEFRALMNSALR